MLPLMLAITVNVVAYHTKLNLPQQRVIPFSYATYRADWVVLLCILNLAAECVDSVAT